MLGKFMLGKLFKKWGKKEDGTTAIEFSLLFIPYLILSLGIIELALMYSAGSLVEGATNNAARMIRTGQIQQASGDQQQMFRDSFCEFATVLVDCNDVEIEVQQMASFGDFDSLAPQFDGDGNFVPTGFDPGGSNDRVLIRVFYRYDMMTPFIGPLLAGADNSIDFISTIVLQTEPYEFEGAV